MGMFKIFKDLIWVKSVLANINQVKQIKETKDQQRIKVISD